MLKYWLALGLSFIIPCSARALPPVSTVQQGRNYLVQHNITNAHARFAEAVAANPANEEANVLLAATRLLVLPYNQVFQQTLNRLSFSQTNRDIYNWTAEMPADTNGTPVPPENFSAMESLALIRTNWMPEIDGAFANLSMVKSPSFLLNLSREETTSSPVLIDLGDVQMLRALCQGMRFWIFTLNSESFDAQLSALYKLKTSNELSVERLLVDHPKLLQFRSAEDFSAARQAFESAVDLYMTASSTIRSRVIKINRLFTLDADMFEDEAKFRQTLAELKQSWSAPVLLSQTTNSAHPVTVRLSGLYDVSHPWRSFLPLFKRQNIIIGSLPDATFNGAVQGFFRSDIETFLSEKFTLSSHMQRLDVMDNGRIRFLVDALNETPYAIGVSSNLVQWDPVGVYFATNGVITMDLPFYVAAKGLFYAARDLSEYVSFRGRVLDFSTGEPIPGAVVQSTIDPATATTDSQGRFYLLTRKSSDFIGSVRLTATAAGYVSSDSWFYSSENHMESVAVRLWASNPPGGLALASIAGMAMAVRDNNDPSNNYLYFNPNGTFTQNGELQGPYQYTKTANNTASMVIGDALVVFHFSGPGYGDYTYQGPDESSAGVFQVVNP